MNATQQDIAARLTIACHGFNLLLRLSRSFGLCARLDFVERDGWTEVLLVLQKVEL